MKQVITAKLKLEHTKEQADRLASLYRDINFNRFGKCVFWFSNHDQCMRSFTGNSVHIPITDIVKMVSFEDNV